MIPGLKEVVLARRAGRDDFEIVLPGGESYLLASDRLEQWLEKHGVLPGDSSYVIQYVWNFQRALVTLGELRVESISKEQLDGYKNVANGIQGSDVRGPANRGSDGRQRTAEGDLRGAGIRPSK